MGNTGLTLLPPPPEHTIQREGGWALWRPQGTWRQDRGLQGGARSGTHGGAGARRRWRVVRASGGHGGSGSSGSHGGLGDSGGHGGTASDGLAPAPARPLRLEPYYPPPKKFLGESRGSIGHLGVRSGSVDSGGARKCGHLGRSGSRGTLGGALRARTLGEL